MRDIAFERNRELTRLTLGVCRDFAHLYVLQLAQKAMALAPITLKLQVLKLLYFWLPAGTTLSKISTGALVKPAPGMGCHGASATRYPTYICLDYAEILEVVQPMILECSAVTEHKHDRPVTQSGRCSK